jgi:hypothetical protein
MVSTSLAEFESETDERTFDAASLQERADTMDIEEFEVLSADEKRHVLWALARDIPFRYVRSGRGKMRRYLAGGVVPRCKVPTVLFETFPRIREFRQSKGRAYASYTRRKSSIFVDFGVYSTSSDYGVREADVAHELMHAMLRGNDVRMPTEAFRRDGRTDRAWYYNHGFPNWDFGGKDVAPSTYLHYTDSVSMPVVSEDVLEDMLTKRLAEYDANGLHEGADEVHARDGRADPFSDDVTVSRPESDREAFLMLVGEANIAWYTTAKAFSEGYEEVARNSIFWCNYTATNPDEMLCKFHEFFQNPGSYAGTHATIAQAIERHPWLLKRYLDCFEPHPDKRVALDMMLDA